MLNEKIEDPIVIEVSRCWLTVTDKELFQPFKELFLIPYFDWVLFSKGRGWNMIKTRRKKRESS